MRIGVLGGMGSAATAHFFNLLVKYQQEVLKRVEDEEFDHVIINNVPLKEWDHTGFLNPEAVKQQLFFEFELFKDCNTVVIPCNTIHYLFDFIKHGIEKECSPANVRVINIIEQVKKQMIPNHRVWCSRSTRDKKLYGDCNYCNDKEQDIIDKVILHLQCGDIDYAQELIQAINLTTINQLVLGCTELSLLRILPGRLQILDSSKILVESIYK